MPPTDYLYKYLVGVYRGKYVNAMRVAGFVENADYFLSCLMDVHEQAMFSFISSKLVTERSERWTAILVDKEITEKTISIELMSSLLDEMVKSTSLVRNRIVDANHVLVALTARLVTMVRNARHSDEE